MLISNEYLWTTNLNMGLKTEMHVEFWKTADVWGRRNGLITAALLGPVPLHQKVMSRVLELGESEGADCFLWGLELTKSVVWIF